MIMGTIKNVFNYLFPKCTICGTRRLGRFTEHLRTPFNYKEFTFRNALGLNTLTCDWCQIQVMIQDMKDQYGLK